ncbi:hypothetical protein E2C01_016391 [Portunus trituberculatus]|uniref:Uncharacterized protein n=1 Tax=Portunus trituberculatus TaxID=210409 RepID=A0A5B7DQF6_PORTR|nr:hypothetical protein [Portunus trituberculatus]
MMQRKGLANTASAVTEAWGQRQGKDTLLSLLYVCTGKVLLEAAAAPTHSLQRAREQLNMLTS